MSMWISEEGVGGSCEGAAFLGNSGRRAFEEEPNEVVVRDVTKIAGEVLNVCGIVNDGGTVDIPVREVPFVLAERRDLPA